MNVFEKIAEDVYETYISGKCGIVLEMEHKQELNSVVEILRQKYFNGKKVLEIGYTTKNFSDKTYFAPAVYQIMNITRQIPDEEIGLQYVQPSSYIAAALEKLYDKSGVGIIVIGNYHLLDGENKSKTLRVLCDKLKIEKNNNALILLSVNKIKNLPDELYPYIYTIHSKKPDIEEIKYKLNKFIEEKNLKINESFQREIISYLQGFYTYDIDYIFKRAEKIFGEKAFDDKEKKILELIGKEKVKLLEKDQLLQWSIVKNINIANMEKIKKYLCESGIIMKNLEDAIKKGVDVPKGILIMGLPGTGKSLFAKYAASELKIPLIRLDMGRMMGGYVGDSERNLRMAQQQAEEMSPCILWIDEIEKGFAGSGTGGREEGAYLKRMVGGFLTWLQEKNKSCYIIATANSIKGLPPEFFRKGRFDECFFTAMPSSKELREIFKVHLLKPERKHVADIKNSISPMEKAIENILQWAAADNRFMTGADASTLVSNTFRRLYIDYNLSNNNNLSKQDYDREHLDEVMKAEFENIKVYSETNGEDIANYYKTIRKSNFINVSECISRQNEENYDQCLSYFISEEISKINKNI